MPDVRVSMGLDRAPLYSFYLVYLKVLGVRVEILMIVNKYYAHATDKNTIVSRE